MSQNGTSLSEKKFVQCPYYIKDALALGWYQCQGSIDHKPGEHVLPNSGPQSPTKSIGQWWPTFEEAVNNNR